MGYRQAVRHQFLVLAFGGSNPSTPSMILLVYSHSRVLLKVFDFCSAQGSSDRGIHQGSEEATNVGQGEKQKLLNVAE